MKRLVGTLLTLLFSQNLFACELVMGYRTNARLPLIAAAPDNRGVYNKIYATAAQQIGCSLRIVRKPKKRILKDLQDGLIDFYPGFDFTPELSLIHI